MKRTAMLLVSAVALAGGGCADAVDGRERLMLGTTHTLEDSGLLAELVAAFSADRPGYLLTTVVAGSGEILGMARRGDLDVLLTHSPDDEAAFMAAGFGDLRHPVMHNEFVLVGPPSDPAHAEAATDVLAALRVIQDDSARFVSRGDHSGTHRRELGLWAHAQRVPGWTGYVEAAAGMADALRVASQRAAYTLADRATWELMHDDLQLRPMQADDARLLNEYSVIVVADARNQRGARAFADWLRTDGLAVISGFGEDRSGSPLFTPAAPGGRGETP